MSAFINEFHYDNASEDVGEFIEVAVSADSDLTGWSLVLYNGNNGASYNTIDLTGLAIADGGAGFGFVTVNLPTNGLQNGSPDGIALVDDAGSVVEFLSYEGAFTAADGPAAEMTSTDIGVSEPGTTPIGQSLQRQGVGDGLAAVAGDFIFAAPLAQTPGAVNVGQSFGVMAPVLPSLVINEFLADPAADLSGDANGDGTRDSTRDEFIEIVNTGQAEVDLSGVTISDAVGLRHVFADETMLAAGAAIVVFGGGTPTGEFGGSEVVVASSGQLGLNNGGDTITLATAEGETIAEVVYGSEGGGDQSLTRDPDLTGAFVPHTDAEGANGAPFSPGTEVDGDPFIAPDPVFTINEIDSDQTGTDNAEFIELYDGGVGNSSLDGLIVALFNGSSDSVYDSFDLDGFSTDEDGFFVIGSANVPNVDLAAFVENGLQNGADAVALYQAADLSFLTDGGATTENLIDAIVYDTNDSDDAELLAALGQTVQFNEGETNSTADALARVPDGDGGFVAQAPTPGATNVVIAPPELVLISQIQGSTNFDGFENLATSGVDDRSALEGETIRIQAVVTADFQSATPGVIGTDLNGFYVQEEDADADDDAFSSEGIFIFDDFAEGTPDVQVGDLVEITGTVTEFFGETQIGASAVEVIASNQLLPSATTLELGSQGVMIDQDGDFVANLEAYEGMRVTFQQDLTVTELFQLGRFGTFKASADGRLEQFSQNNAPDTEGFAQHLQDIAARTITLDDGTNFQNPETIRLPDGNDGVLTADDSFRMGDTLTNVTGVLGYSENFQSSSEEPEFRIHLPEAEYTATNPRPESPEDVGGTFKVASLNVLNYFTTLDDGTDTAGPNNDQDPRGADDLTRFGVEPANAEFERQANKIVQAIVEIDADVLGLVELENDDDIAIADLVGRVNAVLGSEVYGFIPTGDFGGDAITVGMIYKIDSANPLGDSAGLFEFDGRNFLDPLGAGRDLNRPALAQTFQDRSSGETITVAVNHLKSKGSLSGVEADNDQLDGQGNNNATRTEAAKILADWLASDPTGQGSENTLIVGDLNAYAMEDPITALEDAGYTDLADELIGNASSFVFDGQAGTLDYALANAALTEKVTGVTEWRINSDEATVTDYNLDFGRDPSLYNGDTPARNSDHDPVIVGFDFRSKVIGTEGRDQLVGTGFDDFIDGLGARDTYTGLGGADTFVMGDGATDGILDFSFTDGDLIDVSAWGAQSLEELDIIGRGRTITLLDGPSGNRGKVTFDDEDARGDALTPENFIFAPVEDLFLTGGRRFDRLEGRAGDDLIDGGTGFNFLAGNGGADTFVVQNRSNNSISDFVIGEDLIDVSALGATGIEDLSITDRPFSAVVKSGFGVVKLSRIDAADLDEDSFVFADALLS